MTDLFFTSTTIDTMVKSTLVLRLTTTILKTRDYVTDKTMISKLQMFISVCHTHTQKIIATSYNFVQISFTKFNTQ